MANPDLDRSSYRRHMPGEWVAFVDEAQSELGKAGARLTVEVADNMLNAARQLDGESLERARYFGLGIPMIGISQSLQNPEVKAQAIDEAADGLYRRWFVRRERFQRDRSIGLLIEDIHPDALSLPFYDLAEEGIKNRLTPAERLAIDALGVQRHLREMELLGQKITPAYKDEVRQTLTRSGEWTKLVVGGNATSAMSSVVEAVLVKRHLALHPLTHEELTLAKALEGRTLEDLNLKTPAIRAATFRRDEFFRDLDTHIQFEPDGRPVLNRSGLVPPRALEPTGGVVRLGSGNATTVLHTRREKCPALSVEDLPQQVVDVVTQSVTEGENRIKEKIIREGGIYYEPERKPIQGADRETSPVTELEQTLEQLPSAPARSIVDVILAAEENRKRLLENQEEKARYRRRLPNTQELGHER